MCTKVSLWISVPYEAFSMPASSDRTRLDFLLRLIDEGFDKKAWHGPNLRGSVKLVEPDVAAWRPGPERHTIWEIAVHAAYWKYAVRRRITGEDRGSFPFKGSNWFVRPDPAVHHDDWPAAWDADRRLLDEMHRQLRAAVAAFDPDPLDSRGRGASTCPTTQILGIAMHDVYHAGQIQMLKKLDLEWRRVMHQARRALSIRSSSFAAAAANAGSLMCRSSSTSSTPGESSCGCSGTAPRPPPATRTASPPRRSPTRPCSGTQHARRPGRGARLLGDLLADRVDLLRRRPHQRHGRVVAVEPAVLVLLRAPSPAGRS